MHNDKYLYKTICEVVPHATMKNKEYNTGCWKNVICGG